MTSEQIVTIIVAIVGSGVLTAIVTSIANRKKAGADTFQTYAQSLADAAAALMEVAEHRIANLCERAESLEERVRQLEGEIYSLKTSLLERERMIDTLQTENAALQAEVEKLRKEVKGRDARIRELEKQVAELTSRLDAMNGTQDGCQ